jgi:hypothetical protein
MSAVDCGRVINTRAVGPLRGDEHICPALEEQLLVFFHEGSRCVSAYAPTFLSISMWMAGLVSNASNSNPMQMSHSFSVSPLMPVKFCSMLFDVSS